MAGIFDKAIARINQTKSARHDGPTSEESIAEQTAQSAAVANDISVTDRTAAEPQGLPPVASTAAESSAEFPADGSHNRLSDVDLGKLLVNRGQLSELDFARVKRIQTEEAGDKSLPVLLVDMGMLSEHDVAGALADFLGLPLTARGDYSGVAATGEPISTRFLRERHSVPLGENNDTLELAMADPRDDFAARAIAMACGKTVRRRVGAPSDIDQAINQLDGDGKSDLEPLLNELEVSDEVNEEDVEQLRDMASEAPVIRLVNHLLRRAADSCASDIHIEPYEGRLKVRLRIDGVLQDIESPPVKLTAAIVSRIKIMAKLNIAERRLPQDGRVRLRVQGRDLDVRVSTVPTMHGESVVMRLLNRGDVVLDLTSLGFADDLRQTFLDVLAQSHGMIVVTGPTGSGKTTTLYTALNILNTEERKIITAEDPVEYQLEGINQIQVKPTINLTFANTLRSIVRQDPDVIMVGEMRDLETARICVQSALTGHLVLSTLHTNNAASTITRLLEMGIEDYLLTSTLNAVIGQRLVRVLCRHCREAYQAPPELVSELALRQPGDGQRDVQLWRARGCDSCNGTGYRGRSAAIELLVMNETIRRLVLTRADANQIKSEATKCGMSTIFEDACGKALHGITSIEEVLRVTEDN
ncbi:MAG: type II secretion system ATPase GspE [Gammaproteobacteria bacterium]